MTTLKRNVLLN